jgi:glucosamine 6-phosphate synthetase-like amidotransferase/phosphosugar isomerase protein
LSGGDPSKDGTKLVESDYASLAHVVADVYLFVSLAHVAKCVSSEHRRANLNVDQRRNLAKSVTVE